MREHCNLQRKRQREKRQDDDGRRFVRPWADRLFCSSRSDLFCPERGTAASFAMTLVAENSAPFLCSPTRQMGWLTLGCNQQDPWKAMMKGLYDQKPACMAPMRRGMKQIRCEHVFLNLHLELPSLTANPCSAVDKLRCITLSLTADSEGA